MKRVNSKTKRLVRHRTSRKKQPRNTSRKIKGGELGATLGSIFGAVGAGAIFTLLQSSGRAVGEVAQGTVAAANAAGQVVQGTVNATNATLSTSNGAISATKLASVVTNTVIESNAENKNHTNSTRR
jgi:hypothetical protein